MRRLLLLVALLTVIVGWSSLAPDNAQASQMCSVSCSGVTLQCCVSTGSCTSSPGQIECNGVVHTCAEWQAGAAALDNCLANCQAQYQACSAGCLTFTCIGPCARARNTCEENCYVYSSPQSNWGC
jgi:hypothetical protein